MVANTENESKRLLIISSDGHAGPSLTKHLRNYCPPEYLDAYDAFVEATIAAMASPAAEGAQLMIEFDQSLPWRQEGWARVMSCEGQYDPAVRLRDMDTEGIAAEVVFAGGANGEVLPFIGLGWDAGIQSVGTDLRGVGCRIWNEWLADYCAVAPHRLLGVVQVPIQDIEASVRELEWCHKRGLKVVNLPAPRRDFTPYNDPSYDPFWNACEEMGFSLVTHTSGGEVPLGMNGPGGPAMYLMEAHWFARRGVWELILGGVFERHPRLTLIMTEQRVAWVPGMLKDMDSIYESAGQGALLQRYISRKPSSYWHSNCFNGGSFLAKFEFDMRDEVGVDTLMWGSDYPHPEGTWPATLTALRHTFAGEPEEDVRKVLGENALRAYMLDEAPLREVADRIGPTMSDINTTPTEQDYAAHTATFAYRTEGQMIP